MLPRLLPCGCPASQFHRGGQSPRPVASRSGRPACHRSWQLDHSWRTVLEGQSSHGRIRINNHLLPTELEPPYTKLIDTRWMDLFTEADRLRQIDREEKETELQASTDCRSGRHSKGTAKSRPEAKTKRKGQRQRSPCKRAWRCRRGGGSTACGWSIEQFRWAADGLNLKANCSDAHVLEGDRFHNLISNVHASRQPGPQGHLWASPSSRPLAELFWPMWVPLYTVGGLLAGNASRLAKLLEHALAKWSKLNLWLLLAQLAERCQEPLRLLCGLTACGNPNYAGCWRAQRVHYDVSLSLLYQDKLARRMALAPLGPRRSP